MESPGIDFSESGAESDRGQGSTVFKTIIADRSEAIREGEGTQRCAVIERATINLRNAFLKLKISQGTAMTEGIESNLFNVRINHERS